VSWLCSREKKFSNNFNEQKLFEILKAGIKKQFPVVDVA
jgi:hypothetical protein